MKKKRIQLIKNGRNSGYFEIKAQEESEKAELTIYGDISSDKWTDSDVVPQEIEEALAEADGKDLDIYINSGGGNVFAGLAIYHMLNRYRGKKTVYINGLAGSIASIIAMAGDEIVMPKNSYLMIHKAWGTFTGNASTLSKDIEILEKTDDTLLDIYTTKINDDVEPEEIEQMMEEETWLTGEEAQEYFDIIVEEESQAVACIDGLSVSAKIPISLKRGNRRIKNRRENLKNSDIFEIEKARLNLKLKIGGIK